MRRDPKTPALLASLIILVTTGVYSKGADVSDVTPLKIKIIQPWTDTTITLVVPGSPGPFPTKCTTETLKVRRAIYQMVPTPPREFLGLEKFSILEVDDPHSKKWWFIDGEHSFYVSDRSGMRGFTFGPGVLIWTSSYFGLPDANSSTAAIAQFEKEINPEKLNEESNKRLTTNRIRLMQSVPQFYFSDAPVPGTGVIVPLIEAIDITDGILRLDMRHSNTQKPGSIWIDLTRKRVIRSVFDGQEMDLTTGKSFAVPLKKP
jgi:hypothetical protein